MTTLTGGVRPSPILLLRRGDAPHTDRAVRTGELVTVARAVYAQGDLWRELAPWDRYLARVHAAALTHPGAVFCGESAAALRGLAVFGEPRDIHVVASPNDTTSRATSGLRMHTAERMPGCTDHDGITVVTAAEASIDIARSRHHAIGLAVAGSALRMDSRLTPEVLKAINETRLSSRGRRHARWVTERASGIPESPLENVSLAVVEWLGFPPPQLQQWVRGPRGEADRVDFRWVPWALAGESDGDIKYSGEWGDAREALRARSARDARLLERGIRAVAHWGWADAALPAQLRAKLLAIGLPLVSPETAPPLRSLAAALGHRAFTHT